MGSSHRQNNLLTLFSTFLFKAFVTALHSVHIYYFYLFIFDTLAGDDDDDDDKKDEWQNN